MRRLPFDFVVKYVPGSRMSITDYLSRDLTVAVPKEEDQSELIIAKIKELNILKNLNLLKTATSLMTADAVMRGLTRNDRRIIAKANQTS